MNLSTGLTRVRAPRLATPLAVGLSAVAVALAGCGSTGGSRAAAGPGEPTSGAASGDVVDLALLDETPIAENSATLYVQGLSCPACATNVDHQLMDVPGVRLVRVNLGDGTVALSLGGGQRPSRAALSRAIHDSGFTLTRIAVP